MQAWEHKPELPGEKRRILAAGGAVKKYPWSIPYRVCTKTSPAPGLAMSAQGAPPVARYRRARPLVLGWSLAPQQPLSTHPA